MKEIFDYVVKNLPQPFVLACVAVGVVYFAIYYHYSYQSYGDAFRDSKFRTAAILILAIAFIYTINRQPTRPEAGDAAPILVVPLFANDADDKCRAPFVAMVESRLDETLARAGTVRRVRFFVADEQSARNTMENYRASAILYDASVSDAGGNQVVCFKILTSETGLVARLPPMPIKDPGTHVDKLVMEIAGQASTSSGAKGGNPLLTRLLDIERRLGQLTAQFQHTQLPAAPRSTFPKYSNQYAILVGIDKIADSTTNLRFAKSDARELQDLLTADFDFNVTTLLDDKGTKQKILDSIANLAKTAGPDDLIVFYFGGNVSEVPSAGTPSGKVASIVPFDFKWESNHFSILELLEVLKSVPARHKLVIVDGCHATSGLSAVDSAKSTIEEASDPVIQFFGSCKPSEVSYEATNGGVFSQALLRVLRESSENGEAGIWLNQVFTRVESQLAQGTWRQTPQLIRVSGTGEIALHSTAR